MAGVAFGDADQRVARRAGIADQHARRFLAQSGGIRVPAQSRSVRQLSCAEREGVSRGVAAGRSGRQIAAGLGRAHRTICREIARNGGRQTYRAAQADAAATLRARRPKDTKLSRYADLRIEVGRRLAEDWSPEQVSNRPQLDFPDQPWMRISHETLYVDLFTPARRDLAPALRTRLRSARTMRHPKIARQATGRGRLRGMRSIHERPVEALDRARAGHWEGDLVMAQRPSAVATIVERTSRYLLLVELAGIGAEHVCPAVTDALLDVPAGLRRSLAWDRGREIADHAQISDTTGCPVFFCDAKSPWQRPTNENTNRLLRQYLHKRRDLNAHSTADLATIARRLNNRPRKMLGWRTPAESYSALLKAAPMLTTSPRPTGALTP